MGTEVGGRKRLFLREFYDHGLKVHHSSPSRAKFQSVYAYNSSPTGLHIDYAYLPYAHDSTTQIHVPISILTFSLCTCPCGNPQHTDRMPCLTGLILALQSSQPLTPGQLVVKQWNDTDPVTLDVNDGSVPANRPN
jgi:hypothetical protein